MRNRGLAWSLPWVLALVGLAVPMVGSGFIGWPFVVGWLVVLALLWWVRPLSAADRTTRLATGLGAIVVLALLGTLGGFYLVPAVVAWLVLVALDGRGRDQSVVEHARHG
jgi:hypothetical protein